MPDPQYEITKKHMVTSSHKNSIISIRFDSATNKLHANVTTQNSVEYNGSFEVLDKLTAEQDTDLKAILDVLVKHNIETIHSGVLQ